MRNTVMRQKKTEIRRVPDYSSYSFNVREAIGYSLIGAAIGIAVCWLCYDSVYSLPLAALICVLYLIKKKKELISKRKNRLLYAFKDFLILLQSMLSSGYSLETSVAASKKELEKQIGRDSDLIKEIQVIINGMRLNKPIEILFEQLAQRSEIEDIKLFSQLLEISKKQGGRVKELINDTKRIICEKIETAKESEKILAAKKTELMIMSFTPAAVILYLRLSFSGFIEKLYRNTAGISVMTVCLLIYTAAFMIGKRIVNIEV